MTTLASLQAQYNAALAAHNDSVIRIPTLIAAVDRAQENFNKKQTEISVLNASLSVSKTQKDRSTIQSKINAARISIRGLQTILQRAQAALTTATRNADVKKAAMDGAKARLDAATPPSPPPPTVALSAAVPPPAPVGVFMRALLVGINYTDTQYELAGCINDVKNMSDQLKIFFPALTDIQLITDETTTKPSKLNIIAAIRALVTGLKPGENVYFHYSGHGGHLVDKNGDEATGYDSCIYPCAGGTLETISDDELRAEIAAKIPVGSKCLVVLDSCHSGTAVDLRYLWETNANNSLSYKEDTHYEKTAGDVLFLSGAADTQTAADTVDVNGRPCGALTWALIDTWKAYGPAIKTKYLLWDVRKFLKDRGYSQVPQLSTGKYIDLQTVFNLNA